MSPDFFALAFADMGTKYAVSQAPCPEGVGAEMNSRMRARVAKLRARLQPGDIVNTNPRAPTGRDVAFKFLSRGVQGTRFGHSALYDGKGHVIESRDRTVMRRPLEDLVRCNQVVAVSPKGVTKADRRRAVAWMKSKVGNDAFRVTLTSLALHGAKPTWLSRAHERKPQKIDRALCSNLIANAYARVPFNPRRRVADTRPVDILHSDHVRVVGRVT